MAENIPPHKDEWYDSSACHGSDGDDEPEIVVQKAPRVTTHVVKPSKPAVASSVAAAAAAMAIKPKVSLVSQGLMVAKPPRPLAPASAPAPAAAAAAKEPDVAKDLGTLQRSFTASKERVVKALSAMAAKYIKGVKVVPGVNSDEASAWLAAELLKLVGTVTQLHKG